MALAYSAGRVHAWLEPELRKGTAATRAYVFKGRTKSADDIRDKVIGRRNHEDPSLRRQDYAPAEVTDASGFRIVQLFNNEVPDALDQLLSLLKSTLPAGDLKGRLVDAGGNYGIREIEFHTSRRLDEPLSIYPRVKAIVEDKYGLSLKAPKSGAKASSYSSVHVLVECEVESGTRACSEIQIRSVFEEAWSEISHRLRYAPAKMARAAGEPVSQEPEFLSGLWLHLDALKSLTDGCAQYADLVDRQLKAFSTYRDDRKPKPLDPPGESATLFGECGEEILGRAREAYRLRTLATEASDPVHRGVAYTRASDAFRSLVDGFRPELAKRHPTLFALAREELAFCGMFAGDEELRSQSERIYRDLMAERPDRVSVYLRLGQLRRDAGDYDEARQLMKEGLRVVAAKPEPDPEANRQVQWLLRRDLAYVCWSMVDVDRGREDAAALLLEAVDLSEAAGKYAKDDAQVLWTATNLLYYLVDLLDVCSPSARPEVKRKGAALLSEVRPGLNLSSWSLAKLDTIVRAEATFGEHARAEQVARVAIDRINRRAGEIRSGQNLSRAGAFHLLTRDEQDIYLYAQEVLSTNLDKPAPT